MTRRGWAIFAAGLAMYGGSRVIGSPNLHMIAVGVTLVPLFALAVVVLSRNRIEVARTLATPRAYPKARVRVDVTLENQGRAGTSLILFEDEVPSALGRNARAVVPGIHAHGEQSVSYLVSCRRRGVFDIGPSKLFLTDPFALARTRIDTTETDQLIVYPEVEQLSRWPLAGFGAGAGESIAHQLYRTGEEFYGMRPYVTGDDLRRIHWRSTARSGELMIRQDEAARRASMTAFLDTRGAALGVGGAPAFERAVSVAASLASLFGQVGYALRLSTPDLPPAPLTQESLLDHLAAVGPSRVRSLSPSLTTLKRRTVADSTLVIVTAPPVTADVPAMIRAGAGFGPKFAVFVYPADPATLDPPEQADVEGRTSAARTSMSRAGWDVFILHPHERLAETWRNRKTKTLPVVASSS